VLRPRRASPRGHQNFTPRGYMDRPPVSRAARHGSKICSPNFSRVKIFLTAFASGRGKGTY
jgi:hypothetical protein